ncbi:MAG: SURF1 family protein [Anaerolineae bacterium]
MKHAFSRQWILTTLLVILGAAVCVRLGIWQLDRLAQRRAFNAHVLEMRALPPLDLNTSTAADLTSMEYRAVRVRGKYDFEHQVALRNQYYGDQYGFHLLTPLLLEDGRAILIDRGWIPADGNDSPAAWRAYDEPGEITLEGIIRLGRARPDVGGVPDRTLAPGQTRLDFWNFVNLERIAGQVPYPLLPVYVQPNVNPDDSTPPIPFQPEVEISEGPHLGYALQWFTFAAILLFGYPFYLRKSSAE